MTRKSKPERLVESLTQQNKIVNRSIDTMVENITSKPGAELRSDWHEISVTAELTLVQDLLLGDADQSCQKKSETGKVQGHKFLNDSKPKTNKRSKK